jgi:hypothetical protein
MVLSSKVVMSMFGVAAPSFGGALVASGDVRAFQYIYAGKQSLLTPREQPKMWTSSYIKPNNFAKRRTDTSRSKSNGGRMVNAIAPSSW